MMSRAGIQKKLYRHAMCLQRRWEGEDVNQLLKSFFPSPSNLEKALFTLTPLVRDPNDSSACWQFPEYSVADAASVLSANPSVLTRECHLSQQMGGQLLQNVIVQPQRKSTDYTL